MRRLPFIHRCMTAFTVVVSLLFSQLALAGYVCPAQGDARAMAEMMAAGQPCDGMDAAQPVLCHQHASASPQSFEAVKLPAASQPALLQVLRLPPVPDAGAAVAAPVAASAAARPPPDPLFLATLRLRV